MKIYDSVTGEYRKATKEEKIKIRQEERIDRAECIKKYQEEVQIMKEFWDAKKDSLTKGEKKALKARMKDRRSDLFELKHPVLSVTKDIICELFYMFEDIMESRNDLYETTYGGPGYTPEDTARVAIAMTQFGPVAANMVRNEVESRIENEHSEPGL